MGIDISKVVGTARVYGAAGEKVGGAGVWILDLGSFGGAWTDTTVTAAPPGWDATAFDPALTALSIEFSPQYAGDRSFGVVTGNAGNTNVKLQLASVATKKWNTGAFPGFGGLVGGANGTGVIVVATGGNGIAAASLAFPASFFAGDSTARVGYVGVSSNATGVAEGLFRVGDGGATALASAGIQSVALNAAGDKLVAGAAESNNVLRSSSPGTASAVSGMAGATVVKRPGENDGLGNPGTVMVVVAFAGTNVVAGSSGPESAFSISRDEGKSFNDVSLIDNGTTTAPLIKDVIVNADGTKVYMVTTNSDGVFTSLWKKVTAWEKVWSIRAPTASYIVRVAPENFDVIYVAPMLSGTDVWYSSDAGEASWTSRISPSAIADLAVESAAVVYALTSAGSVSKSLDSGFLWDNPLSVTGVTGGHMIASISKDNLVVGGTAGDAAFSTNGNTSWTKINAPTGVSGNTHVTASGLASGNFIYAVMDTTSSGVYKYTVGTSTSFSNMLGTGTLTAVGGAKGISLTSGVLYIIASDGTNSVLRRTLTPSTADDLNDFNTTASVAKNYTAQPQALRTSVGADKSVKLWAINMPTALDSFTDTLAAAAPTMTGPAANASVDVNPASGSAVAVPFTWTRLSLATKYDLQIALDSNFTQVVTSFTSAGGNAVSSTDANVVQLVTPTAGAFQPDVTYYWRVRVSPDGPLDSPYAAARSFKVASLRPLTLQGPDNGDANVSVNPTFVWSPVTGATTYELVVSDDPTFAIITFSRTTAQPVFASDEQLAYDTVYYWRVRASAPTSAVTPFATGIFTTEPRPVAPTTPPPPVTVTQTSVTVTVPSAPEVEVIPSYLLWIIIGIGAILVIALIVLIVRTRRTG
jgi:hypothetical protein